jgi:hypothetical protein
VHEQNGLQDGGALWHNIEGVGKSARAARLDRWDVIFLAVGVVQDDGAHVIHIRLDALLPLVSICTEHHTAPQHRFTKQRPVGGLFRPFQGCAVWLCSMAGVVYGLSAVSPELVALLAQWK